MATTLRRSRPARSLIAAAIALGLAGAAHAQQAEAEAEVLDTIEVTGTRISSPGIIANSPISSYSAEDLENKQSVTVEEFIRLVPGAVPAIGSNVNNGNGGGATIDLRGLGANRVLVLVNGRRLTPFNLVGAVDTNSIPIALIERIDMVTGGASAVYGADAVSGVVNFILKKNFEGTELAARYGVAEAGDGARQRIDATLGVSSADGRGNVVLSVGHTKTDPVYQKDRDFSAFGRSSTSGAIQGSTTGVPATVNGVPGLAGDHQIDLATGRLVPIYEFYNFNPVNVLQTPQDRLQATALGRFEVADGHEAYIETMFTRSDVYTQLASSGTFLNNFQVPVGNPFIPEPMRQQICAGYGIAAANCVVGNTQLVTLTLGRRMTELGPRANNFENQAFQGTVGIDGYLNDTWRYDAYWSFGEAEQIQTRGNWGSMSRVAQALQAVNTTSCLNPANGCVPLNLFGAEGSITPAMAAFINLDAILRQSVKQDVGSVSVTGDLGGVFKSPWSPYPISAAFGIEYRELSAGTKSDQASQIRGEVLGTGAPTPDRRGRFDLKEGYAEFFVPVLNDLPWAYSLSLELGYRYTEFTSERSSGYDTYKYGGEWAPIAGFRVRGLAQRATRAPNVNELFAPQITALGNLATDPCQGNRINQADANTAGTLSNLCRLTGVPLSQIGSLGAPSAGQANVMTGGNPNLSPEVADTLTLGAVWEPSFIDGLALTLDYYDIEVNDAIANPTVTDVLNQCYSTQFNPGLSFNAACALIGRDSFNGSFNGVGARGIQTLTSNQGQITTDGIDLGVNYGLSLNEWGNLSFAWNLNKVLGWNFRATPVSVNRDCVGYYSNACNSAAGQTTIMINEIKSNLRTTWSLGDVALTLNWRYLHGMDVEPGSGNWLPAYRSIPSYNYFDLGASWQAADNLRLTLSIDNVTDKDPPFVGNTIGSTAANTGNTFPSSYDAIGRFYTLGATLTF